MIGRFNYYLYFAPAIEVNKELLIFTQIAKDFGLLKVTIW